MTIIIEMSVKEITRYFDAKYTSDSAGKTIEINIYHPGITSDAWDEIDGWAIYNGFDQFQVEDSLLLSTSPTGPHGYHDPEGTGEYVALELWQENA